MKYCPGLEIRNFPKEHYAAPGVEVLHKQSTKLATLESILREERVEYKVLDSPHRIFFKRMSWPKLNYVLYLAGLLKLEK